MRNLTVEEITEVSGGIGAVALPLGPFVVVSKTTKEPQPETEQKKQN